MEWKLFLSYQTNVHVSEKELTLRDVCCCYKCLLLFFANCFVVIAVHTAPGTYPKAISMIQNGELPMKVSHRPSTLAVRSYRTKKKNYCRVSVFHGNHFSINHFCVPFFFCSFIQADKKMVVLRMTLNTVKSQIFIRYLISYFRTFEKSAKFNTR